MGMHLVKAGRHVPDECNVIIEIPMLGAPIKYEMDKESGAVFVDRFMSTAMHYPCNYGYVPRTLCADGDPVDVLVLSPVPLMTGVVVRARPVGLLEMEDENGMDVKILAVPIDAACALYIGVHEPQDLPTPTLRQIAHFFEHYKDLEAGKWVRIGDWRSAADARAEILRSIEAYEQGTGAAAGGAAR